MVDCIKLYPRVPISLIAPLLGLILATAKFSLYHVILVFAGRKNRQVRAHHMNEHSSRSHTMLILTLTSEVRDSEDPTHYIRRYGKVFLVDLAGSEKTKKTHSRGETLKEANNINKSLLVLGK